MPRSKTSPRSTEIPYKERFFTSFFGSRLGEANRAIHAWCRANGRQTAGPSWEVYGHWNPDPAQLRTEVYHLLQRP